MLAPKAEMTLYPWREPKERIPLAVGACSDIGWISGLPRNPPSTHSMIVPGMPADRRFPTPNALLRVVA